jgi:hypothetical protein
MHWAWSDVKIIYVNRPSRSAVKSKSRLSAWKMPIIDRFCNVLRVSWLYIKRLLPRLFSFGVSAKKRNHIAEMSMEYRRNVNGVSPKCQWNIAERATLFHRRRDGDAIIWRF